MSVDPTAHKEVNALLRVLLGGVRQILGEDLIGLYLYGSLSLGDFVEGSSDVDFLVVTRERLAEAALEQLRLMHEEIAASGLVYARKLEGSYIPQTALRRYDPNAALHPTIGVDWPFQVGFHGSNWLLERWIVREHGIVVWGPPPRTLIEPVAPQQLRAATYEQLQTMWRQQLSGPAWLRPRDYQAFAVLTLCRACYTLRHGTLCSKPQAAAWACATYPAWRPILERSLAWRFLHEEDDLSETLAFLRDALLRAEEIWQQCTLSEDASEEE